MITVEIRINGALIQYIHAYNMSDLGANAMYYCQIYDAEKSKATTFDLSHRRHDGCATLVEKILLKYNNQQGKSNGKINKKTAEKV